jgi:pimeloyl-ACP methyl ester carboxylesterase
MFQETFQREFDNNIINYGIIRGNNTVVFIKPGLNGSMYGYENKYLRIATLLNELYGYTIIVASNPSTNKNPLDGDIEFIYKEVPDYAKLYYMGFSNGAMLGLIYGYKYPFNKMLLINSPIMYNLHKQKEGLSKMSNRNIKIVFGSLDQSIKYVELLNPLFNNYITLDILDNIDHEFKGNLETFINLPINYFK